MKNNFILIVTLIGVSFFLWQGRGCALNNKEIIAYVQDVEQVYQTGFSTQDYGRTNEDVNNRKDAFINQEEKSITYILNKNAPSPCQTYKNLSIEILKLVKKKTEVVAEKGADFMKSQDFININLEIVEKEVKRNTIKNALLQKVDFWNIKESGVNKQNMDQFEFGPDGKLRRK